jgi:acetone carboxylase gamma subunit
MSEKKIQRRAVVVLRELVCPCCGVHQTWNLTDGTTPHIIINRSEHGVIITLTCPECLKPVQVYAAGESYTSLKTLEAEGEYEK